MKSDSTSSHRACPIPSSRICSSTTARNFARRSREAVASLSPRERNLLRHSVIDGLGIDQIAAIYHVHRATAARQLKQARTTLVATTRERMRIALGIGETELDSIFRVLVSMADVTLREILAPARSLENLMAERERPPGRERRTHVAAANRSRTTGRGSWREI